MSVLPAISPISRPETAGVPYITTTEFTNAPTGIQTGNITAGELAALILRASSWLDLEAHQVLAATTDTEFCQIRVHRDGTFSVFPRCYPVRAVTSVSVGPYPGDLTALTSLSTVAVQNRRFKVYQGSLPSVTWKGPIQFGPSWSDTDLWCQYTYVNGYPVSTLQSTANTGVNSLTVVNGTGILPGMTLTITDDPNTETVTVASSYTFGSATVPLVSNTLNTHAAGVPVTAMPPGLKQIAILATAGFIVERGTDALVMASLDGGPSRQQTGGGTGNDFLQQARQMLNEAGFVAKVSVQGDL